MGFAGCAGLGWLLSFVVSYISLSSFFTLASHSLSSGNLDFVWRIDKCKHSHICDFVRHWKRYRSLCNRFSSWSKVTMYEDVGSNQKILHCFLSRHVDNCSCSRCFGKLSFSSESFLPFLTFSESLIRNKIFGWCCSFCLLRSSLRFGIPFLTFPSDEKWPSLA